MSIPQSLTILFPLLFTLLIPFTNAATFAVLNKCTYTVWAAAKPGGGMRLDPSQSWTVNVNPGTTGARIWGRTNCNFNASGNGQCQTGDCNGLLDPTTAVCKSARCAANIVGECPTELQTPDGCNNPCTVFKTNEYCCTDGPGTRGPTRFSKFFKDRCPDAYSNPDSTSLFTCPAGTNYAITFCP
ncbi:hypothetical protein ACSBR2_038005 [Camellia fascicularis]